jgi:hypothetical protein
MSQAEIGDMQSVLSARCARTLSRRNFGYSAAGCRWYDPNPGRVPSISLRPDDLETSDHLKRDLQTVLVYAMSLYTVWLPMLLGLWHCKNKLDQELEDYTDLLDNHAVLLG